MFTWYLPRPRLLPRPLSWAVAGFLLTLLGAAVVPLAPDPAAERDLLIGLIRAELAARVAAHRGGHVLVRLHRIGSSSRVNQFTTSSRATSF